MKIRKELLCGWGKRGESIKGENAYSFSCGLGKMFVLFWVKNIEPAFFYVGSPFWTCLFFDHLRSVFHTYNAIFIFLTYCQMAPLTLFKVRCSDLVFLLAIIVFRIPNESYAFFLHAYETDEVLDPIFIPLSWHASFLVSFFQSSCPKDNAVAGIRTSASTDLVNTKQTLNPRTTVPWHVNPFLNMHDQRMLLFIYRQSLIFLILS